MKKAMLRELLEKTNKIEEPVEVKVKTSRKKKVEVVEEPEEEEE